MNVNIFCSMVKEKLGRPLKIDEKESILKYLNEIQIEPGMSLKLAFKFYLDQVVKVLQTERSTDVLDFKEYQIVTLGTNKEDGQLINKKYEEESNNEYLHTVESAKLETLFLIEVSKVYDLSKEIAPKSKLKYNYLMLDSDNCFEISNSRDKFQWLLQEEHPKLQKGYINLHSKMRNIVMARLGRMTMAHMYGDFAAAATSRNRFAFGFDEFASQALITPTGTRFQFIEFLPEYDTNYGTNIVLSPFNANRGWFRFRERFKMLDKLSLTITNLNTMSKVQVPIDPFSFTAQFMSNVLLGPLTKYNVIGIDNDTLYLPINYYYGQVGYEYDMDAMVQGEYKFSGFNSGIPAIDLAWNTGTHQLRREVFFGFDIYYPVPALPLPPANTDFVITLPSKPRFTGVLELISEDDSDDDTPI